MPAAKALELIVIYVRRAATALTYEQVPSAPHFGQRGLRASLSDGLLEHQSDSFSYGRWDCCLFVCDAIRVMTGIDLAADYRGAYSSRM
jgi:hypothetical protein